MAQRRSVSGRGKGSAADDAGTLARVMGVVSEGSNVDVTTTPSELSSPSKVSRAVGGPSVVDAGRGEAKIMPLCDDAARKKFYDGIRDLFSSNPGMEVEILQETKRIIADNIYSKLEMLYIRGLLKSDENFIIKKTKSGFEVEFIIERTRDSELKSLKFLLNKSQYGIGVHLYKGSTSYYPNQVDEFALLVIDTILNKKLFGSIAKFKGKPANFAELFGVADEVFRIDSRSLAAIVHVSSTQSLTAVARYGTGSSMEPHLKKIIANLHRWTSKTRGNLYQVNQVILKILEANLFNLRPEFFPDDKKLSYILGGLQKRKIEDYLGYQEVIKELSQLVRPHLDARKFPDSKAVDLRMIDQNKLRLIFYAQRALILGKFFGRLHPKESDIPVVFTVVNSLLERKGLKDKDNFPALIEGAMLAGIGMNGMIGADYCFKYAQEAAPRVAKPAASSRSVFARGEDVDRRDSLVDAEEGSVKVDEDDARARGFDDFERFRKLLAMLPKSSYPAVSPTSGDDGVDVEESVTFASEFGGDIVKFHNPASLEPVAERKGAVSDGEESDYEDDSGVATKRLLLPSFVELKTQFQKLSVLALSVGVLPRDGAVAVDYDDEESDDEESVVDKESVVVGSRRSSFDGGVSDFKDLVAILCRDEHAIVPGRGDGNDDAFTLPTKSEYGDNGSIGGDSEFDYDEDERNDHLNSTVSSLDGRGRSSPSLPTIDGSFVVGSAVRGASSVAGGESGKDVDSKVDSSGVSVAPSTGTGINQRDVIVASAFANSLSTSPAVDEAPSVAAASSRVSSPKPHAGAGYEAEYEDRVSPVPDTEAVKLLVLNDWQDLGNNIFTGTDIAKSKSHAIANAMAAMFKLGYARTTKEINYDKLLLLSLLFISVAKNHYGMGEAMPALQSGSDYLRELLGSDKSVIVSTTEDEADPPCALSELVSEFFQSEENLIVAAEFFFDNFTHSFKTKYSAIRLSDEAALKFYGQYAASLIDDEMRCPRLFHCDFADLEKGLQVFQNTVKKNPGLVQPQTVIKPTTVGAAVGGDLFR